MEILDLRKEIDSTIATGAYEAAFRGLTELWRRQNDLATAGFIVSRYETLRDHLPLLPYRLAILRSFTLEPIVPLLRAGAFAAGIDLTVHLGDFNAYAQEILDPNSSLYRFQPHAAILAVQGSDIVPDLWRDYAQLTPEQRQAAPARVSSEFRGWVGAFRKYSQASLIVHALEQPAVPSQRLMDAQSATGQLTTIQLINIELRRLAEDYRGVYILDYDALVARYGRLNWHDERKWLTVRMPIAANHLIHLANEWLHFLAPLTGKIAKALVVDLDNTLWGGVVGEDGMRDIKVGSEYPGAAYQALQRAILDLYRRGILLAICSKNNVEDAMEALKNHPGMLLRPQHFASMRINWEDKAQNLRDIAAELNIGTDALALVDDNPVERQDIRTRLPEVTVIELPEDPMGYAAALSESPVFERLVLSAEDQHRSAYYTQQRARLELQQSCSSKEDFYRSLQQEVEIALPGPATLARIAQLTQKTNQFNLTTRRYSEQQIVEMAACPGWKVLSLRLRDRFGDNGLVGVAITHDNQDVCEIDTFLLSCRVIGRAVETAWLAHLVGRARAGAKRQMQGWFLPTKKNAPAREFYPQHGFRLERQEGESLLWVLDLSQNRVICPEWIKLTVRDGGTE